jgi:H+/Cl- antiporter ClcA
MPIEIIKEQPFLLLIIIIIIIYQLIDIVNYIGCWLMNLFSTWQRSHVVGHSSHRVTCGAEFLIVFELLLLLLLLLLYWNQTEYVEHAKLFNQFLTYAEIIKYSSVSVIQQINW